MNEATQETSFTWKRSLGQAGFLLLTTVLVGVLLEALILYVDSVRNTGNFGVLYWLYGIIPGSVILSFFIIVVPATIKFRSLGWIVSYYVMLAFCSVFLFLLVFVVGGYGIPNIWTYDPSDHLVW